MFLETLPSILISLLSSLDFVAISFVLTTLAVDTLVASLLDSISIGVESKTLLHKVKF